MKSLLSIILSNVGIVMPDGTTHHVVRGNRVQTVIGDDDREDMFDQTVAGKYLMKKGIDRRIVVFPIDAAKPRPSQGSPTAIPAICELSEEDYIYLLMRETDYVISHCPSAAGTAFEDCLVDLFQRLLVKTKR